MTMAIFPKRNCHFIPPLFKKFFSLIDLNDWKLSLVNNFGSLLPEENLLTAKIRSVAVTFVCNLKCIVPVTAQANNKI